TKTATMMSADTSIRVQLACAVPSGHVQNSTLAAMLNHQSASMAAALQLLRMTDSWYVPPPGRKYRWTVNHRYVAATAYQAHHIKPSRPRARRQTANNTIGNANISRSWLS